MMRMFRVTVFLLLLVTASAQTSTSQSTVTPDRKAEILAKTHGPVHDLVAELFTKDDATLDDWAKYPKKIGKLVEGAECNPGETQTLSALAQSVKQYRAAPSQQRESDILQAAFMVAVFNPGKREELADTLEAAIATAQASGSAGGRPPSDLAQMRKDLDRPNPPQIEVPKEVLACHWIPTSMTPAPKLSAGPAYEVIVGPDGSVKSAKVITGGELPGWAASVKTMHFRPFYLRGEAIPVKSIVIPQ
jgi:hypothetical protein